MTRFDTGQGVAFQTPEEKERLIYYALAKVEGIKGLTDQISHRIRVTADQPIKQRYRPRNPAMHAVINHEVEQMEKDRIIELSQESCSSPVVVV